MSQTIHIQAISINDMYLIAANTILNSDTFHDLQMTATQTGEKVQLKIVLEDDSKLQDYSSTLFVNGFMIEALLFGDAS